MTSVTWLPYCGAAPGPAEWLTRWNLDPVLLAVIALCGGVTLARLDRWRGPDGQRRQAAAQAALLIFGVLYVSPFCALGSAFFTARVLHHMVLVLAVAPLLAFALEPWRRRLAGSPWLWTVGAAATFWFWHAPGPYSAALSSTLIFWVMQLSLLATATGFWAAVRRAEAGVAIGAVLATTVQMGLLGALITFSVRPLYPPHFASALGWGVAPLADQQLAGVVMWAPGSFAYLLAALLIGRRWLRNGTPVRVPGP